MDNELRLNLVDDIAYDSNYFRLWSAKYLNRKNRKRLQRRLKRMLLLCNPTAQLPLSANCKHLLTALDQVLACI